MTKAELVAALASVDDDREVYFFWDGWPRSDVQGIYEADLEKRDGVRKAVVLCSDDYYCEPSDDPPTRWVVPLPCTNTGA